MFGFPIVLAALAMMGAPATTPVGCNPDTTSAYLAAGLTWFDASGRVLRIDFSPQVCAGLIYMAASQAERTKIVALNPGVNLVYDEGLAAVVILHESHHATGDHNEAATECAAITAAPAFIESHVPATDQFLALGYAKGYDSGLPPSYHLAGCN